MRSLAVGVATLALATITSVASVDAQVRFGLGGGPTFSLEEGGGTEFHAMGTVGFGGGPERPLGFRIDGMYTFVDGGNALNGTGNVVYNFSASEDTRFRPYLIGGGGLYYFDSDFGGSSTNFGLNGGAGFNVPIGQGTTKLFGEARFHAIFADGDTGNILPVTIGIMFGGS